VPGLVVEKSATGKRSSLQWKIPMLNRIGSYMFSKKVHFSAFHGRKTHKKCQDSPVGKNPENGGRKISH